MEGTRHQGDLGSRFAQEDNRRKRGRAPLQFREDRLHARALGGELPELQSALVFALEVAGVVGELLAEAPVLAHGGEAFDRLPQDDGELFRVPGLLDVAVDGARVDGLDEHGQIGVRREQDADDVRAAFGRAAEELDPAHAGHALVADDRRPDRAFEDLERLVSA